MLWPSHAHAYAWMIRHGYSQCAQCHVDPSGSGALTAYGHDIAESKLRTHYDAWESQKEDDRLGNFLFGAVELPDELDFGGDVRVLSLHTKAEGTALQDRFIWMQVDGKVAVHSGPVVGSATLGYAPEGALGAAITPAPEKNLVSREHWFGVYLDGSHETLLRAGRMNVPFGVRSLEHTLWTRVSTGTDINDQQQYGLSLALSGEQYRAEIMGILGSWQIRPDQFRQRGYSGTFEYSPINGLAVGASSRVVHLDLDTRLLKPIWHHTHGVFGRWASPWEPLVLLTEWDYVQDSPRYVQRTKGVVGYLQADVEATQGVHFMTTFEARNVSQWKVPTSYGVWLSYAWFFAPHADIRLDNIYQSFGSLSGRTGELSFLLQAHVSL